MKGVDSMHEKVKSIDYYTENWYAMLVSILKNSTVDNALEDMGVNSSSNNKKKKVFYKNVTENDVIEVINLLEDNPDITLREACEIKELKGITLGAMYQRICRYKQKQKLG